MLYIWTIYLLRRVHCSIYSRVAISTRLGSQTYHDYPVSSKQSMATMVSNLPTSTPSFFNRIITDSINNFAGAWICWWIGSSHIPHIVDGKIGIHHWCFHQPPENSFTQNMANHCLGKPATIQTIRSYTRPNGLDFEPRAFDISQWVAWGPHWEKGCWPASPHSASSRHWSWSFQPPQRGAPKLIGNWGGGHIRGPTGNESLKLFGKGWRQGSS